eukprot:scaffold3079_cov174-Amphora_coffeaeformis.AAC.16
MTLKLTGSGTFSVPQCLAILIGNGQDIGIGDSIWYPKVILVWHKELSRHIVAFNFVIPRRHVQGHDTEERLHNRKPGRPTIRFRVGV